MEKGSDMEKWTLIFWMDGKKYDEHILEKETPIPRIGEQVRIPEISHPVVKRYEGSHFKRKWPIAIPREVLGIGGVQ